MAYYLDGEMVSINSVNSLAYNASVSTICKWKVINGHHIFKASVDDGRMIWESNEKNNTFSINIAPDMADLSITNVVWSPAEIPAGREVVFTIDVENIGGISAGASRLVYYVDGSVAGFNDIAPVAAGAKITQTFTWAASEGQHNISIVADSKGQVAEIDELNNTVTVDIPPPDLIVQDVRYSGQGAMTGETVTVTASIINERGSRTAEAVAECSVDGVSIGTQILPRLEAGKSAEVSFEWIAEPGSHIFKVYADANKSVMEIDETNNEGSVIFTTTSPDLSVDSFKWAAVNKLNSNEIAFTVIIKNSGGCESGAFSVNCTT